MDTEIQEDGHECLQLQDGIASNLFSRLPRRPPVTLEWQDVIYRVPEAKGTKLLLKGLSGRCEPGKLTAIMGASGAGKTTLMNVLAGYRLKPAGGNVTINGKPRNLNSFYKRSCYIMKDDLLLPYLSTLETLTLAAKLKLSSRAKAADKANMVEELLEMLGLTACRHTRTKNLSGGQKKRLCIALELLKNPSVMMFDEPTSGLDSKSCYLWLKIMQQLAAGGRTVICTIHQPSAKVFEMFQNLYVLADGHCIYDGRTQDMVSNLATLGLKCPPYHNPADFILEVASGEYGEHTNKLVRAVKTKQASRGDEIHQNGINESKSREESGRLSFPVGQLSLNSEDNNHTDCQISFILPVEDSDTSVVFATGFLQQSRVLFVRTFLSTVRDSSQTHLRLLSHVGVGLLLGAIFYNAGNDADRIFSNTSLLFFNLMFLMFLSLMATLITFPEELPILVRERLNCWYSMRAYFISKSVADLPIQAILSTIYIVIVYLLSCQPLEWFRFGYTLVVGFLISFVAQSTGLLVGAFLGVQNAIYVGIGVLGFVNFIFAGFYVQVQHLPTYLQWVPYLSYLHYAYRSSMQVIYKYDRPDLECSKDFCYFVNPEAFLEEIGVEPSPLWLDILILISFAFLIRIAAFLALRFTVYKAS